MEILFISLVYLFLGLIFLFILYLIIKSAVTNGIDDSILVKELNNEIKELKRQIKSEERNREV